MWNDRGEVAGGTPKTSLTGANSRLISMEESSARLRFMALSVALEPPPSPRDDDPNPASSPFGTHTKLENTHTHITVKSRRTQTTTHPPHKGNKNQGNWGDGNRGMQL
jgi:hypothetical protein